MCNKGYSPVGYEGYCEGMYSSVNTAVYRENEIRMNTTNNWFQCLYTYYATRVANCTGGGVL